MIRLIARHELRGLLGLPSTWCLLALLQFIFAWFFLARLDAYLELQPQLAEVANAPGATASVIAPLFAIAAILLLMLVPLFSMRLVAEERRNRTLPLLLAAPVSSLQIVLGKYLGLMMFLAALCAGVLLTLYPLTLGTPLDHGLILCNATGLLLCCAAYAALGLYFSTLANQPWLAGAATLASLLGLWLIDFGGHSGGVSWLLISPMGHFENLNAGLLDSGDVLYFILFSATCLWLAGRRLEQQRREG